MNLYITGDNLGISAISLDNVRIKKQLVYLAQVISNVLHDTTLYDYTFSDMYSDKAIWLLPERYKEHNLTIWAKKSPLHLHLLVLFYLQCNYYRQKRKLLLTNYKGVGKISLVIGRIAECFDGVLYLEDGVLEVLKEDLYRGLPVPYNNEKNTIIAYQKYLTSQWKSDILARHEFDLALAKWDKASGLPKPRAPQHALAWGINTAAPEFAREELKQYKEGLKNAKNNTTVTSDSNTGSSNAA